jgi:hypothetical protein
MPKNSVCAEIGVHEGDYSEEILRSIKPRKIHLIDPWEHKEDVEYKNAWYGGAGPGGQEMMDSRYGAVMDRFGKKVESGRVVLHRGYSSDVASEFEDDYFDWVYIDGNHLHEYVMKDLELYFPKVKSGGYLAGDDYGIKGWWNNGVQTAVEEFVEQRPELSLEVRGSQFIIKKA